MSTIHDSVRNGKVEEVRAFIAKGGDVNMIDKHKRTPLHLAAWSGNYDVLLVLINAKAQLDKKAMDGFTILHFAVQSNSDTASDCVRLICKKAKHLLSQRITKGNKTALHLAVAKGNIKIVEILLEYGLDPLARTSTGQTAVDMAKSTEIKDLLTSYAEAKNSGQPSNQKKQSESDEEQLIASTIEEKREDEEGEEEEQAKKKLRVE
jgi:ankyrin repeat protein